MTHLQNKKPSRGRASVPRRAFLLPIRKLFFQRLFLCVEIAAFSRRKFFKPLSFKALDCPGHPWSRTAQKPDRRTGGRLFSDAGKMVYFYPAIHLYAGARGAA
jgi:hypothetical protein